MFQGDADLYHFRRGGSPSWYRRILNPMERWAVVVRFWDNSHPGMNMFSMLGDRDSWLSQGCHFVPPSVGHLLISADEERAMFCISGKVLNSLGKLWDSVPVTPTGRSRWVDFHICPKVTQLSTTFYRVVPFDGGEIREVFRRLENLKVPRKCYRLGTISLIA